MSTFGDDLIQSLSEAVAHAKGEGPAAVPDKCSACAGTGEEDDADCGDISFNKWRCHTCNGAGTIQSEVIE